MRGGAEPPAVRGTRVHTVFVRADGARLAGLAALAEASPVTPRVAETFPLQKAAAARERFAAGGAARPAGAPAVSPGP